MHLTKGLAPFDYRQSGFESSGGPQSRDGYRPEQTMSKEINFRVPIDIYNYMHALATQGRLSYGDYSARVAEALLAHNPQRETELAKRLAKKYKLDQPAQRILRVKSAARLLGVSVWKVRDMIHRSELPCQLHVPGAPFLVDVRDLEANIERKQRRGP